MCFPSCRNLARWIARAMNNSASDDESVDPAAVFGIAESLWRACHRAVASDATMNLSETYSGIDGLMREVMRVGVLFERWATRNVQFDELTDVWPYLLQDRFGPAAIDTVGVAGLGTFGENDSLRVALRLRLPVRLSGSAVVPIDLAEDCAATSTGYRKYRIQTVRWSTNSDEVVPFTADDDPFDAEYGPPFFALYGVTAEGKSEHVVDRPTYASMFALVRMIAPTVSFPDEPVFCGQERS